MLPATVGSTWKALAEQPATEPARFDPATLAGLPAPAARWLARAIPAGAPLRPVIELDMTGRIRLGPRWMPFTATQILRPGVGFVWKPVVGGRVLRFTGADLLGPHDARMEFRLHGLVPVARASGPGTARSASGRLAAEAVAWAPTAATPQCGATWAPLDDDNATVTLATPTGPVAVTVAVTAEGQLTAMALQRWNDTAKPPALQPFGADVTAEATTGDGVRIAGSATVGWGHGTPQWDTGRFFEFTIVATRP